MGEDTLLPTRRWLPSRHAFDYISERLRPISSETGLRHFEAQTVENMVQDLFDGLRRDPSTKRRLGFDGEINFQDHTNLGDEGNEELARRRRDLRLQQNTKRGARQQSPYRHRGTADQFCIFRSDEDDSRAPLIAIEYKPPHKLTPHTISVGLKQAIRTHEDVIGRIGEPLDQELQRTWWCRYAMAATVTQLFSYMVTLGIRYGYICTGQAYVFVRISDTNLSEVSYSVHIPTLDFNYADDWRLHQTAVARVFAFIIQAAGEVAPTQDWHRKRDLLSPWKVDLQSVLHDMPESIRTNTSESEYVPDRFVQYSRSPIRIRTGCRPNADRLRPPNDRSGSDEEDQHLPESPTEERQKRKVRSQSAASRARGEGVSVSEGTTTRIQDRRYCTHECLRGLVEGGHLDSCCPNFPSHGSQHLRLETFLKMVIQQLHVDTGVNASCMAMNIHGARGGLLKICLARYGYTLVAKGTEEHNITHLHHEQEIYRRLWPLQGKQVPVCLGVVRLRSVYHYSGARLSYLLLMSWAGRRLSALVNRPFRHHFPKMATDALRAIHELQVRHNDVALRNMVYDAARQSFMYVDFELSIVLSRPALSPLHANMERDWTSMMKYRRLESAFEDEMSAVQTVMRPYLP